MPAHRPPTKLPIRHVAIIGTGLIGGSWALALKRHARDVIVTACDRAAVLAVLASRGGCDQAVTNPVEAVADADLIILAPPLALVGDLLRTIAPHVRPDALVTDVGSVKTAVGVLGDEVLPGRFVGGHPMAGSEHAGVAHASPLLFENAAYALCPTPESRAHRRFHALVDLIDTIGARVLSLDAQAHDQAAAHVSHVPQLLAVALTNAVGTHAQGEPMTRLLAGGGFRDMTRIASSPYATWEGILSANAPAIRDALRSVRAELDQLETALVADQTHTLKDAFDAANQTRHDVPNRRKGLLRAYPELLLHAVDRPGFLSEVFAALAGAELNVKDVELLLVREGTGGSFRLAFASDDEIERALSAMERAGFSAERKG